MKKSADLPAFAIAISGSNTFFEFFLLVQVRLGGNGTDLAKLHADIFQEDANAVRSAFDACQLFDGSFYLVPVGVQ